MVEEKPNNQKSESLVMESSKEPGFDEMLKEYIDNLDDDENPFLNPDNDLFASNDDGEMTIEDYQEYIDDFKKNVGEEFFKENEGNFWAIPETRTFMGCLFEQTLLFWQNNEKDKAIDQLKYVLKLNPRDDQGVRYVLLAYLLELDMLEDAQSLMMSYGDDYSTYWSFCELLLDIKKQEDSAIIEMEFGMCVECNEYVVPYLIGDEKIPSDAVGSYDDGDRNEAIFYVQSAGDVWFNDENALSTLKELYG
ncbi:MAG: hypothetical protein Q4Q19_06980 [Methanobrevibacter sp.]|nr:hypothetical protein [Methanobrevibacter sp.]